MEPRSEGWPWKVVHRGEVAEAGPSFAGLPLQELYSRFLKPPADRSRCPQCGTTLDEVKATSLYGCPVCIDVFEGQLDGDSVPEEASGDEPA